MSPFSLRQSTKYNVHVGATAHGRSFPPPSFAAKIMAYLGEVAQLGERRVRNAEVGSSILLFSTTHSISRSIHATYCSRFVRFGVRCPKKVSQKRANDEQQASRSPASEPPRSVLLPAGHSGNHQHSLHATRDLSFAADNQSQ